mmetsp:Transcript_8095/g.20173  ORF Transcript_8095/g.20173 Transcript_8095/m.20173 type:complete len:193 (-) Transcript_8095:141-719(-)|eukprot:CAMPEP_0117546314 /NCGR_PEP_ID=MMETSP0784-20121206/46543_1 /TAXON_ID=39447 /ORGANISM="" /LENGTH=192 /DNA_ID=CAMNT_0005343181 /DNA_START=77 /DNA_END=655 /DNA_ORIENTATION=-
MATSAPGTPGEGAPAPDALQDIIESTLKGSGAYTQGFWEDVQAFVHAIDWAKDQWIFWLFAAEAAMLLIVALNRNRWEVLSVVFMLNAALLFFAERLNTLARRHWQSFSSQQYFDEHGSFASVIVGVPVLLAQLAIVICLLRQAACMVIKVKRIELRNNRSKSAVGGGNADGNCADAVPDRPSPEAEDKKGK